MGKKAKPIDLDHIAEGLRGLAVPIGDLVEDPRNARTHGDQNLAAVSRSLAAFGQRLPLVVQKNGMIVRAGNARLQAARALGWTSIAAVIVDEPDVEATAFAIADNRTAELAEWDDQQLAELLAELQANDADPSITGFSDEEIGEYLQTFFDDATDERASSPGPKTYEPPKGREPLVIVGDCVDVMQTMDAASVDAVVTDPPYAIGFMEKQWDVVGSKEDGPMRVVEWFEQWSREALRVLKPGGHMLVFGGSRTYHSMAMGVELSGFEIRDQIQWVYGQGFPKSHNIGKAIDAAAGATREVVGHKPVGAGRLAEMSAHSQESGKNYWSGEILGDPVTAAAKQWDGWGTALKPAHEPIVVARKPLIGTVAANVLEHGTGAINVDGCRVPGELEYSSGGFPERDNRPPREGREEPGSRTWARSGPGVEKRKVDGRWPANFIHDGSEEVVGRLGEAARFFYCAKPTKDEKTEGLDDSFEEKQISTSDKYDYGDGSAADKYQAIKASQKNHHPTVKPVALMAYLCRLVTPPGGTVLDPFNGSGTTGVAAIQEGFNYTGIELDPEYAMIAEARLTDALKARRD